MSRRVVPLLIVVLAGAFPAPTAEAAQYPVNTCVSTKQKEAGRYCKTALNAWGKWLRKQDDARRDTVIQRAFDRLSVKWAYAEDQSTAANGNCIDTTLTPAQAQALIDAEIADIVAEISDGLTLGATPGATCGGRLLRAAARTCLRRLKAEGNHVRDLAADADGAELASGLARASDRFSQEWTRHSPGCPTTATEVEVEGLLDGLTDAVVFDTIVSPNVDANAFETYSPTGTIAYGDLRLFPTCVFGTPYHFFAKRGSVNKVLMYYQGGGACWEQLTCSVPVCDDEVIPTGSGSDNPNDATTGFADLSNPNNPFRDWNVVFVSYCSCDVHYGDSAQDYDNTDPDNPVHAEHRGFHNSKVVEKWAREHFVNPDEVFVTGSSAGAYGAWFNGPGLHEPWPASQIRVLADAGNGVITASFLQNEFNNWDFQKNLPPIPGVAEAINMGTGIVGYTEAVATFFPGTLWSHYTTAFDGGFGGQTGFYNVMLNDNDPIAALSWWEGSCAFNQVMRQQAFDSAATLPDNYRYYIGSGSRHTMWGSNKVYSDTLGGVPTIRDWLVAMLASTSGAPDAGWVNVEANPFNVLLPGDPQPPEIPTPPFEESGSDIVVNCP